MENENLTLQKITKKAEQLKCVRKEELGFGDKLIIFTSNSIYSVVILNESDCLVSGGWFNRKGLSPMKTTITGCTWGGSIIKVDIAAACGLCLEFGNKIRTSHISKIIVYKRNIPN